MADCFWQLVILEPLRDILTYHARNHQGSSHADCFDEGCTKGQCLEYTIFATEATGKGDVGYSLTLIGQLLAKLTGSSVQVETGHTPFFHHSPGAHTGAAGGTIYGKQVNLGVRAPLDGHRQLTQSIGAGFQGNAFESQVP